MQGTEICMNQLSGLQVPMQLTMEKTQTFAAQMSFIAPIETTPGACGPIIYSISPMPELFSIVGTTINVLPFSAINTALIGPQMFLLSARYANFEGFVTSVPFTVTFTDSGCLQPPALDMYVLDMTYTVNSPQIIQTVGYKW